MNGPYKLPKVIALTLAAAAIACSGRNIDELERDLGGLSDTAHLTDRGLSTDAAGTGPSWVAVAGGSGDITSSAIAVDKAGNSWIVGTLRGSATIGTTALTAKAESDVYVTKVDAKGAFSWTRAASGKPRVSAGSIAVDSAGNSYITGSFSGSVSFGSHQLNSSAVDNYDIYVAKLDPQGAFLWARSVSGGGQFDLGAAVAVDGAGNAYVAGRFGGTVDFGGKVLTSAGYSSAYVAKLSPQGAFLWVRASAGGAGDRAVGLAVDAAGKSTVTGRFRNKIDLGGSSLAAKSTGEEVFIARLNSSGVVDWVVGPGARGTGMAAAVDSAGNSYVTGTFRFTATFGTISLTSKGNEDIYVTKLGPTGKTLWASSMGGTDNDVVAGIAVSSAGRCSVVGHFGATAHFGAVKRTASGPYDIYLVTLGTTGGFAEVKTTGGAGMEFPSGIGQNGAGERYVAGGFKLSTQLGPHSLKTKDTKSIFVWYVP
jgi:hypothetical protein